MYLTMPSCYSHDSKFLKWYVYISIVFVRQNNFKSHIYMIIVHVMVFIKMKIVEDLDNNMCWVGIMLRDDYIMIE